MLKPGVENKVDENQDKIMNIYFALNDFGRMHMLLELQELYKQEKVLHNKKTAYPEQNDKWDEEQRKIDRNRVKLIEKIADFDVNYQGNQENVVAFIQFQSMHGKHKLIKTARVDMIRRFCGKVDQTYKK